MSSQTTTSLFQEYPDYYNSIEECNVFNKKYDKKQTNIRYKNFNQIHFTAGDEEQFQKYRYEKNSTENIIDLPDKNLFYEYNIFNGWDKNKNLNTESVLNTFKYLFYKFKKGIFVKIIDNKLKVFLPFSNVNFINEWSNNIKIEPQYKNIYDFLEHITKLENRTFHKNNINKFINSWYANNCLLRYEYPINENDTNISSIKNMLEELCNKRNVPDLEFFINKRDFPLITRDEFEPYYHLWGTEEQRLVSHNYNKYSPILSTSIKDNFADILIPSYEDWLRVQNKENKWFPKSRINYNYEIETEWSNKKNIAVFRGSSTGEGITIETNMRLKVAYLSYLNKLDDDNLPFLDAGITKWNFRPKKLINNPYLQIINPDNFPFNLVNSLSPKEQSNYKYIIHIDGHVSANRISYELSMNSVVLIVESPWKYWFSELLEPYIHYVPIKADLSDLFDKIKWCKNNDNKCKTIANNAKLFYEKYLQKDGILDYLQKLFINIKDHIGIYFYNELNILDYQNQEKINILKDSLIYPLTSKNISIKNIQNIKNIPLFERSYGYLKSIHYIFNLMNFSKSLETNLIYMSNILTNKLGSIDKYDFFNYNVVIKSTKDFFKIKEHIHETFIGVNCINKILKNIPNFVYHFGYFKTADSINIITEYISNITLQSYIISDKFDFKTFLNIIIQLCLALETAQEQYNFMHCDLTPWNIMLKFLKKETTIEYIIKNKIVKINTNVIPVIIDYGKSNVVYKNIHYGFVNMYNFNSGFDILTLLITTIHQISISQNLNKSDFIRFLKLSNFISKMKIYNNEFKTLKQVKSFFHSAKKYSNLINLLKNNIYNCNPLDLINYIVKNLNYFLNINNQYEYKSFMNKYDPKQLFNYIISNDNKDKLNSFLNRFKNIKNFNFDNINDNIFKLYILQRLETDFNNIYNFFIIFIRNNNLNINNYEKYYNEAYLNLKNCYNKITFKSIINDMKKKESYILNFINFEKSNIKHYNEVVLTNLSDTKLILKEYNLIYNNVDLEKISDELSLKTIFKNILFFYGTFKIENKIFFIDTYLDFLNVENKIVLNKLSNIITFFDHVKLIYNKNLDSFKKIHMNNIDKNQYIKDYYTNLIEIINLNKKK